MVQYQPLFWHQVTWHIMITYKPSGTGHPHTGTRSQQSSDASGREWTSTARLSSRQTPQIAACAAASMLSLQSRFTGECRILHEARTLHPETPCSPSRWPTCRNLTWGIPSRPRLLHLRAGASQGRNPGLKLVRFRYFLIFFGKVWYIKENEWWNLGLFSWTFPVNIGQTKWTFAH